MNRSTNTKTLLEYFLTYFKFLYSDPRYRIMDSRTSGASTVDAGLTLRGPIVSWSFGNNRGQIHLGVAPSRYAKSPEYWFRIPVVRQYLDHYDETNCVPPGETAAWIRDNRGRIEDLFCDASAADSCKALIALEKALAIKYFGPPKA
jgi:hypothetical protein